MNDKLTIQDLTDLLAEKHGMDKNDAEAFVQESFLMIERALERDKYVKIKGLGTFKLIDVDSRESIDVNTGERIQIQGHTKVSFVPDNNLRDTINKPFSHFDTVLLNENTILEDTPSEEQDKESSVIADVEKQKESSSLKSQMAEEIISLELKRMEMASIIPPVQKEHVIEESELETPQEMISQEIKLIKDNKDESPTPYLVAIIIIVLLVCGGALYFIYQPDMFSTSGKDKIDLPEPSQQAQHIIMMDTTVTETDTINHERVKAVDEIKPSQGGTKVDLGKTVVKTGLSKNEVKTDSIPITPKYSESAKYTITGTKATYTIKEGETLTKVSLRFYGTKAMWPYIVRYNQEVIKNPDNVPYGTQIKIPELLEK